MDPHSRPAQGLRVTYVFYPRIVVKEGADGFTRHQLGEEEAKGSVLQGCSVLPLLRELIPSPVFQGSLLLFSQGRILPSGKSTCAQKPKGLLRCFLFSVHPRPSLVPVMGSVT